MPEHETGEGEQPRVAVACIDDDTLIREGFALLFPDLDVVATFADIDSFLEVRPMVDVVVLDLNLAGTAAEGARHGAAAVRAVASAGYHVLIYTNERRREVLAGCLARGARGVVHKAEPLISVTSAVRSVATGHVVITSALTGLAEVVDKRGHLPALSARQREILSARARGESFRSIADRLVLSKRTVEDHMAVVNAKFADYLHDHSVTDLETYLGITPGDLLAGE